MRKCDKRLWDVLQAKKPQAETPYQLRLPSRLQFSCNDDLSELMIEMGSSSSKACAAENMQTDSASFEGWSLVLKSILPGTERICLKWDIPDRSKPSHWKHYQRFLYRVNRFRDRYSWFTPVTDCDTDMRIRPDAPPGYYKVNLPTQARDSENGMRSEDERSERDMEIDLVRSPERLKAISGAEVIGNQLPIGVFGGSVARGTAIFTGQASAIDLWGTSKETETLSIFELKKRGNTKVGSISELFFYAMVMKDLVDGTFAFGKPKTVPTDVNPWPPEHINGTIKKITAYVLADRLHPLFGGGNSLFSLLNDASDHCGVPVTFGYINYGDVAL